MLNASVALIVLMIAQPMPRGEVPKGCYYPVGSYDKWGYSQWGDFGEDTKPIQPILRSLRSQEYSKARRELDALHARDKDNITVLCALAQCAFWQGKLVDFMDTLAKEAYQGKPAYPRPAPPLALALTFQYCLGIIVEENNAERKFEFNAADPKRPSGFYYSDLGNDRQWMTSKDKRVILMGASSLDSRDFLELRSYSAKRLSAEPNFFQLRLAFVQSLKTGILLKGEGDKKPVPAPKEEWAYPERAYSEALRVVNEHPEFVPAYYLAGKLAIARDRPKARELLSHFVKSSKDEFRKKTAKLLLEFLASKPIRK